MSCTVFVGESPREIGYGAIPYFIFKDELFNVCLPTKTTPNYQVINWKIFRQSYLAWIIHNH
ncbi:MAG: hypothetical protein D6748_03055 [Calditrichaeota bacterium]|nr:MAG: hypothetical protein D6748_03055 [Calditrichota bacterium]